MDNVTHSLVGVAVAESCYQLFQKYKKSTDDRFRWILWVVSFVGSNLPDLDMLYAGQINNPKLGYLVHHRGHTHTFFIAVIQGLLLFAGLASWSKFKKIVWTKHEWCLLAALSVSGPILHILLDFLNMYGVHPGWPFNNRWYYGDTLFIVEPWIWVTLLPIVFFSAKQNVIRIIAVSFEAVALGLLWFSGYVFTEMALIVTFWAVAISLCFIFLPKKRAHGFMWLGFFAILSFFYNTSIYTKKKILRSEQNARPGVVLHDLILMPLPTNPFCWQVISVESFGPVATYRMRYGIATPFPEWISYTECMKLGIIRPGQVKPIDDSAVSLHWLAEKQFDISSFRKFARSNCDFKNFLLFSRAPVFSIENGKLVFSDWRFDLRGRKNFTHFESSLPVSGLPRMCPSLPPWIEPRRDLLTN